MSRESDNFHFVRDAVQPVIRDAVQPPIKVDGWAGERTQRAWDAYLRRCAAATAEPIPTAPDLRIDRSLRLPADQYLPDTSTSKDLIVLHHTSGGSAKSTFDWWRSTPERIGTAYIVERDGTIFEVFDPRSWAYHLGVKGSGTALERRSIGIEIASEGGLTRGPGDLYAFGVIAERTRFRGEVVTLPEPWRGFQDFAAYTPAALQAVFLLVGDLCREFGVPRLFPSGERAPLFYRGVAAHSHFRADKTDVHAGFPWADLAAACRLTPTG